MINKNNQNTVLQLELVQRQKKESVSAAIVLFSLAVPTVAICLISLHATKKTLAHVHDNSNTSIITTINYSREDALKFIACYSLLPAIAELSLLTFLIFNRTKQSKLISPVIESVTNPILFTVKWIRENILSDFRDLDDSEIEKLKRSYHGIILITLVGPLVEELIFRSLILGFLAKVLNFTISNILHGLLFTAVHFREEEAYVKNFKVTAADLYTLLFVQSLHFGVFFSQESGFYASLISHIAWNGLLATVENIDNLISTSNFPTIRLRQLQRHGSEQIVEPINKSTTTKQQRLK